MKELYSASLFLLVFLSLQEGIKGGREKFMEQSISEKSPVISDLEKLPQILPKCAEGCLRPLLLTLRASFVSGNNYERLVNTCDRLREVYQCMDTIQKCQPNHLFRVFTDGFKYMCVDQSDAFRDIMECMDLHAHIAIEDCKQQCSAHKLIIGWFIYLSMQSTTLIQKNERPDTPPRVNSLFFRKITTEACTILQCYFLCLKTKYNARCHGIGGNLLMEVIVRPMAAIHNSVLLSPLLNVMKLMMPIQCNFVMTDAGIAWQRIDPKLEKDLKEFYKNRTEPLVKFRLLPDNVTGIGKVNAGKKSKRNVDYDGVEDDNFIFVKSRDKMNDAKPNSTEFADCANEYDSDESDDDNNQNASVNAARKSSGKS